MILYRTRGAMLRIQHRSTSMVRRFQCQKISMLLSEPFAIRGKLPLVGLTRFASIKKMSLKRANRFP
ncbi:hypothetical protein CJF31_00002966 [Rutstroemia sp. NJR-2017a BVV2]|nr:hypothetical protein CJF31_00002966 [Rutstroemia sp. NJR-2017a BVV2]